MSGCPDWTSSVSITASSAVINVFRFCLFVFGRGPTASEMQLNRMELYLAPFLADADGNIPEPTKNQLDEVSGG